MIAEQAATFNFFLVLLQICFAQKLPLVTYLQQNQLTTYIHVYIGMYVYAQNGHVKNNICYNGLVLEYS